MPKTDFSMDNDYKLLIQNGDFVIQNQELQQANVIIKYSKGEVRQFPLVGVSIDSYVGSTQDKTALYNTITNQLKEDGLLLDAVSAEITSNSITFEIKLK